MFTHTIKAFYNQNRQDPFISVPISIVILVVLIISIVLGVLYAKLPPQIPLYYSLPWGDEQLTHPSMLFFLLGGGFVGFWIHVVIGNMLKKVSLLFTHILIIGSAILYLLLIFSVMKIIFLVI